MHRVCLPAACNTICKYCTIYPFHGTTNNMLSCNIIYVTGCSSRCKNSIVSIANVGVLLASHNSVPIRIPRDLLSLPNLPLAERAEADCDGDILLGHRVLVQSGEQRGRGTVERELRREPRRGRGRRGG
uniref:Uncharacterized protein n=1 Tax=Arundo donax TaxID=35708 RepID=A0A0A9DCX6_ARUDO